MGGGERGRGRKREKKKREERRRERKGEEKKRGGRAQWYTNSGWHSCIKLVKGWNLM